MTDTLTFSKVPVPAITTGRAQAPNPFDGHFPTPRDKDGKPSDALAIVLDGDTDATKATVTNLTGKARRAAERLDPPQTARVQVTTEGKGKTAKTTITFWTVDKIKRPSQTGEGTTAE